MRTKGVLFLVTPARSSCFGGTDKRATLSEAELMQCFLMIPLFAFNAFLAMCSVAVTIQYSPPNACKVVKHTRADLEQMISEYQEKLRALV
jgi:hypothetical protein